MEFNSKVAAKDIGEYSFAWLADAGVLAKRPNASKETLLALVAQLEQVLAAIAKRPDVQSSALRLAYGTLVRRLTVRINATRAVTDLLPKLVAFVEAPKNNRFNCMKHFAVTVLGHIAEIPMESMRHLVRNLFIVLAEALRVCPSAASCPAGYRRDLLWALANAARNSDPSKLEYSLRKAVWKQARSLTSDPAAVVGAAAFQLLEELAGPELVKTKAKLEKLTPVITRGYSSPHEFVRIAAARFYARLFSQLETLEIDDEAAPPPGAGPAPKTTITLKTVLKYLGSQYASPNTSPQAAAGIVEFLRQLLEARTPNQLREEFAVLVQQLALYLVQDVDGTNGYRLDLGVQHLRFLIVDVVAGKGLKNEQMRLDCINKLIAILVKSSKEEHICCIGYVACLTGLVDLLGPAVTVLANPVHQTLIALMENSTEWGLSIGIVECFGILTTHVPQLILPVFTFALQHVSAHPSRSYAYLAATLAAKWTDFAKYGSVELNGQLLSTALAFIKQAQAGHPVDDHIKMQVGWILLEGVMCLGPRIVKLHISQFLLLWKSTLAKPAVSSHPVEVAYQLKTRQLALSALATFVARNGSLITTDVANRLGEILHIVWSFVDEIPQSVVAEPDTFREESLILRRLLECYALLAQYGTSQAYPASMLTRATHFVLDPDYLLADSGKDDYSSIYEYTNNCARGVTALGFTGKCPVISTASYDADQLLIGGRPLPLVTGIVDAAISVISLVLASQPPRVQESLLDRVRSYLDDYARAQSPKKPAPASRRLAASINASLLLKMLTHTGKFAETRIFSIVLDSIKLLLPHPDRIVRENAAEAFGQLAGNAGMLTVETLTKELIETLITNVDPVTRNGFALALAGVATHAASLVHATQWQTALVVVTQLSSDPHPLVHRAAIQAMTAAVSNSGLLATKYAEEGLADLTRLYLLDTHSSAAGPAAYSNFDLEYPTTLIIATCCRVLVSLVGPDLAARKDLFDKVYRLVDQFQSLHQDPRVVAQAWGCFQELFYFAKQHIDWISQVREWTRVVSSAAAPETRAAALDALLLLFKTSPQKVFAITGSVLQPQLWLAYDEEQSPILRELFWTWLEHTAIHEPEKWILRLQAVIMRPRYYFSEQVLNSTSGPPDKHLTAAAAAAAAAAAETADEDQSLGTQTEQQDTELMGWSTRQFACEMMLQLARLELRGKSAAALQNCVVTKRVRDVIKIAFSAATSAVFSMQLVGLELLNELVSSLCLLADPDFPEVRLLEQYQAQISSALTPAFAADSSPELAIAALKVCGTFIASGIIKHAEKMGRILRIMTDALKSCAEPEFSLGDLELSPNAQKILRVAVLRLWADVLVASQTQEYLEDIVEPLEQQLVGLWVSTTKDYARMRFEPEQASSASLAEGLELMHAAQLRQVLMVTYEESWLNLVSALATLIETKGEEVLSSSSVQGEDITFVLFGMCFEALLTPQVSQLPVLTALQRILLPGVSASVIYEQEIFTETIDVLDRILLTGNPAERSCVIHIARNVATGRAESDESVDDLFELFRLCTLPLRALFPSLADVPGKPPSVIDEPEYLDLIKLSLDSLVEIVQVFREVIQNDLYVCLLYIFEKICEIPQCQQKVVPHIFSSYRELLEVMDRSASVSPESRKLVTDAVATAFVDASKQLETAPDELTKRNSILTCMVILCTNHDLLDTATGNASQFGALLVDTLYDPALSQVAAESMRACLAIRTDSLARSAFTYGCIPKLVSQASNAENPAVGKIVTKLVVQYAAIHPTQGMALALTLLLYVVHEAEWIDDSAARANFVSGLLIRLLESHSTIFKQTIQALDSADRDLLRNLLVHDESQTLQPSATESSIVLTSFS